MDQISEHIKPSNHKIHSYDKMSKIIVNLVSKKGENNDNSSFQLTRIHNPLLMSIFYTPENDVSMLIRIYNEKSTYIFGKFTINIILLFNKCNV